MHTRPQHNENYNHEDDNSNEVNGQDDGLPILCSTQGCGNVFEYNEGYKSGISDKLICESCHVDEMVENEKHESE